jgi:hypothetical protein
MIRRMSDEMSSNQSDLATSGIATFHPEFTALVEKLVAERRQMDPSGLR